jgi:excisionase family DNA binding protein
MVTYPYEVLIFWSDEDQAFIAEIPDLPGAMADGATRQEALANAEVIIQEWIETAQELDRTVPASSGRFMTVSEVAERLGLSVAMVRRYCETEAIPATKAGRDWSMRQRDVERFAATPRRRGRKKKSQVELNYAD